MQDNKRLSDGPEDRVSAEEIKAFYNDLSTIYPREDPWHYASHREISDFVLKHAAGSSKVLNLGSGGSTYGLKPESITHIDLLPKHAPKEGRFIIGDVQNLPDLSEHFDFCVCVGSVLNHCDASAVITGAARNLEDGGRFCLEFETSRSAELLKTNAFGRSASVVNTFYQGKTIRLWAYSEEYIESLVKAAGFRIIKTHRFFIFPPVVYLFTKQVNLAVRFKFADFLLRRIPWVRRFCGNIIFLCEKRTSKT